ncbi:MAG: ATP-binding cassette, subfamily multidrug efflux pump, partial [Acidimicrobiaceae bacterium]
MLIRLLRTYLGPYRKVLLGVVALTAVQTTAALALPTLNANIIDKGVIPGDVGYIRSTGALMIAFTILQIVFAVGAVYFGGKVAMSFGRDLRKALFHQVTEFSTREVGAFGAPSLITRITNDVQQVQMLVVMTCTMAIAAPITMVVGVVMALRQDVGLSTVLLVSMPAAAVILGVLVSQMVPAFRLMQDRIDQINRVLREQITGIRVVRAFVREPQEAQRFATANDELTATSLRAGRLMSSMFPTVNFLINLSSVGVL